MSDFDWSARSGLENAARVSLPLSSGVRIAEIESPELILVLARHGKGEETSARAEVHFGVKPQANRFVAANGAWAVWTGPGQFLLSVPADPAQRAQGFAEAFAGVASVSDQSNARIMLEVSGEGARDVLCRVCSLDLADSMFPAGHCAATSLDHIAVTFWRMPDGPGGVPSYRLLVPRSYAASLWESLHIAAGH